MASLKILSLGMHDYEFIIWDAEIVHDNLPSITHFSCYGAKLAKREFSVQPKPNSVTTSMSFNFNRISDFQDVSSCEWLVYILKKYTGLEKLFINIKEYGNVSFQNKNNTFENGWLLLLKSIGPHLEQIGNINIPDINIFKTLDTFECKVKDLSLLSSPSALDLLDISIQSNQCHHIQKLGIKNIMIKNVSLKGSRLVELELIFSLCHPNFLSMSDFLKCCPPTLKHLTMEHVDIKYDRFDSYKYPSITCIYINRNGSMPVSFKSRENVCRCCPNLKRLHLFEPSINFFI